MRFNAPALTELKNQLFTLKFIYHKKDLVPLTLKNKIFQLVNYKYSNSAKPLKIFLEINSNSMIGIVGQLSCVNPTDLLVGLLEPSSGSFKRQ